MIRTLCLLLLLFLLTPAQGRELPRNIVLVIGDGMGLAQISAAHSLRPQLSLRQFPVIGLVATASADALVTDSAAAATALASGHKTRNQAIGVDPAGRPLPNLVERARAHGMATGLVVTSRITHATPAAFVAHVGHRREESRIAEQLASSGVELLFGGGRDMFLPRAQGGQRKDGKNLLRRLARSHHLAEDAESFARLDELPAVALLDEQALPRAGRRPVSLAQMTAKALELLARDPDGFFLMVEGSQIDWAGHRNDAQWLVQETLDLDNALATVLAFARRDGNTLVVVTADHETGGLALEGRRGEHELDIDFTTRGHTASLVPLFAFGPGATAFAGILDNTDIGQRLLSLIGQRAAGSP